MLFRAGGRCLELPRGAWTRPDRGRLGGVLASLHLKIFGSRVLLPNVGISGTGRSHLAEGERTCDFGPARPGHDLAGIPSAGEPTRPASQKS